MVLNTCSRKQGNKKEPTAQNIGSVFILVYPFLAVNLRNMFFCITFKILFLFRLKSQILFAITEQKNRFTPNHVIKLSSLFHMKSLSLHVFDIDSLKQFTRENKLDIKASR